MNKNYKTEQENFWATNFGDNYIQRNNHTSIISTKCSIFTDVLRRTRDVKTILELGSNIGLNLRAIKLLKNDCELSAVEINPNAAKELKKWGGVKEVFNKSILDFQTDKKWDLIIISGVLIHINPEFLNQVYDLMSKISIKYVLISEYYNPTPVELDYRGHKGKLFKRDFAGEMLDRHNNFSLLDYGFVYHRDNNFPLDDGTWFLLEKDNYKKPIMPFLKEISGKFENGNIIVYDSEISLATHHVAQGGVALIKDLVQNHT